MAESKPIIPEIITSKIIDQKQNEDNFLQWKRIMKIHVTGRGNESHLTKDPPKYLIQ